MISHTSTIATAQLITRALAADLAAPYITHHIAVHYYIMQLESEFRGTKRGQKF